MPRVEPHVVQLLTGVSAVARHYDEELMLAPVLRRGAHKAVVHANLRRRVLTPHSLVLESVLRLSRGIPVWHAAELQMLYVVFAGLYRAHNLLQFLCRRLHIRRQLQKGRAVVLKALVNRCGGEA